MPQPFRRVEFRRIGGQRKNFERAGVPGEKFQHLRRLLGQMNFSVQRPKTRLVQANPRKQNRWIRYTLPNLKKKPAPKGR